MYQLNQILECVSSFYFLENGNLFYSDQSNIKDAF